MLGNYEMLDSSWLLWSWTDHKLLPRVNFDPVAFFEGLKGQEYLNKPSFFLRELDMSLNPTTTSKWLKKLAKLIGMCGLNFEKLALNQVLEDPAVTTCHPLTPCSVSHSLPHIW